MGQKWGEVKQLLPARDSILQQEMVKQENNERLRVKFAQKANVVGPWLEAQLDRVAAIGHLSKGSLEENKVELKGKPDYYFGLRNVTSI